MPRSKPQKPDPALDLVLDRVVDVPPALVWKAWTTPKHLLKWFTPSPWKTVECEIDLRPGGIFRTIMQSPEGQNHENIGCYLEVVKNKRLVWTDALTPGFRPSKRRAMNEFSFITAIISLEAEGTGTRYVATAIHADEEGRKAHEQMGFHEGWGTVLNQLVALCKTW